MSSIPDQRLAISDQRSLGRRPKVLALSSTGGHWIQMLRLRPAFEGYDVTYATTNADYQSDVLVDPERSESKGREATKFRTIIDANRTQKLKLLLSAFSILWVILRVWPDAILSTGAAPGFFAIRIGKLLGKKTIWVDSIANAEELSMSGQKAGKHADLWLTQWEDLANPEGPHYFGNVLGDSAPDERSSGSWDQGTGSWELETDHRFNSCNQKSEIGNWKLDSPTPIRNLQSTISNPESFRIFVTVGSDVPFDRMVKVIDQWAGSNSETEVFAQIGTTSWKPESLDYCQFLSPKEFSKKLKQSDLIIAHAGMGSILTALKEQKPILVMPRRGHLNETRNDHQVATAKKLQDKCKLAVASDEKELRLKLESIQDTGSISSIGSAADESMISRISAYLTQVD